MEILLAENIDLMRVGPTRMELRAASLNSGPQGVKNRENYPQRTPSSLFADDRLSMESSRLALNYWEFLAQIGTLSEPHSCIVELWRVHRK
jgi:hypothetical protein